MHRCERKMVICAMVGCGNRSDRDKEKRFFRLPTVIDHQGELTLSISKQRQSLWLSRIKRQDLEPSRYRNVRVCSDHFVSGEPVKLYEKDNVDWAPSLKLGYSFHQLEKSLCCSSQGRSTRLVQRNSKKRLASEIVEETNHEDFSEKATQTYLSAQDLTATEHELEDLKDKVKGLQTELKTVKAKLENIGSCKSEVEVKRLKEEVDTLILDERAFVKNDDKVLYYTGLTNWDILQTLFLHIQPSLMKRSVLSPFQQLLVVLMRLRLNLACQDLAYRFKVHCSTISRNFHFVLDILYTELKPLILWPDRDTLRKTMPMDFRQYCPSCVVIIDCFEIFVERATNLLARAQTYSAYKHHNTVKYLIGITPQGTVSYISDSWGGRTSDKYITEHSNFLQNLIPGDTILADRGFDIHDSVGSYSSQLKIPAFIKGKNQLSAIDVEQTRSIANVRIHVERVIGNLRKKYSILSATQPIDFVTQNETATTLDKIVCVSCGLINLCNSVVPFD